MLEETKAMLYQCNTEQETMQQEYKELLTAKEEKYVKLQEEHKSTRVDFQSILSNHEKLQGHYRSAISQIEELQSCNHDLRRNNQNSQCENITLLKDRRVLSGKVEQLKKELSALKEKSSQSQNMFMREISQVRQRDTALHLVPFVCNCTVRTIFSEFGVF